MKSVLFALTLTGLLASCGNGGASIGLVNAPFTIWEKPGPDISVNTEIGEFKVNTSSKFPNSWGASFNNTLKDFPPLNLAKQHGLIAIETASGCEINNDTVEVTITITAIVYADVIC